MVEHTTHRFEPNTQAIRKEQLLIGAVVALFGPGLLYLEGERNALLLLILGVIGGVVGYGVYAIRNHLRGVQRIDMTPEGLTVVVRQKELFWPWDTVDKATHQTFYGDYVVVHLRGTKRPRSFLLDGYTPEQITAIIARICEKGQHKNVDRS